MSVALLFKSRGFGRFPSCNFQFALVWLLGQVAGYILVSGISVSTISVMRCADFGRVAFGWLLVSSIAPFLLTYFSLVPGARWLLLFVLFAKGLLFAFCICCAGIAFGDAAWVFRWLCFFSNCLCTVFFLWFVFFFSNSSKTKQCNILLVCSIAAIIVTCFDYMFISPFIVRLLD